MFYHDHHAVLIVIRKTSKLKQHPLFLLKFVIFEMYNVKIHLK